MPSFWCWGIGSGREAGPILELWLWDLLGVTAFFPFFSACLVDQEVHLIPLGEGHTLRCITSFSSEHMVHGIGKKKNKNNKFFFQAASKTREILFIVEIKGTQRYSLAFSWNRLNFSTQ